MDPRLFMDRTLKLRKEMLDIPVNQRLVHDEASNIVYANMSGLDISTKDELAELDDELNRFFTKLGRKVNIVANYDGISIAPRLSAKFMNLLGQLEYDYYLTSTHYTTSAFMRQKLGHDFKNRSISPHIFESREEAAKYLRSEAGE